MFILYSAVYAYCAVWRGTSKGCLIPFPSSLQVVSQAVAEGEVEVMADLEGVQGQEFDSPLVVVVERLTGNEDIPPGITAVLTSSATDVLSHIAIRARSQVRACP